MLHLDNEHNQTQLLSGSARTIITVFAVLHIYLDQWTSRDTARTVFTLWSCSDKRFVIYIYIMFCLYHNKSS